jgi:fibronectin-binding autotransporter adhesin
MILNTVFAITGLLTICVTPALGQGTGGAGGGHTWLGTSSTDFFDTANWNTGFWPNGIAVYGPAGGANTTIDRSNQTYTYQYGIQFTNTTDANGNYTLNGTQAYNIQNYGISTTDMTSGTLNEVINPNITNNVGSYNIGLNHDLTLNGIISSPENVVKNGVGTMTLNGINTYVSDTIINAGTLKVTNSSKTPSYDIASGATLELSATPTANVAINGAGTFNVTGYVSASAIGFTTSMDSGAYIDIQNGGSLVFNGGGDPWTGNKADVNVDGWLYGAANSFEIDALTGGASGLLQMGGGTINLGVDNGTGGVFDGNIRRSYADAHLDKQGTGTQTLNGEVNLGATGTVTVSEGTLIFNGTSSGSNATGSWTVENGATLSGSGTLSGTATIGLGGILSPGNSPGTQTFDNLAWSNGGTYLWEINADLASGGGEGADPGWDWINVTSDWDISGITTGFNIDITSLTNPGNVAGLADGFDYTGLSYLDPYESFTILSFGTLDDTFDASLFTLNDSGFSNPKVGWSLEISGNDLVLNAVFVPEPSSTALLGLGGLALMLRRKRS